MKEESNHLIEYYTVMKKAGKMIFGESVVEENKRRSSFGKSELMDEEFVRNIQEHFDSDNSDDIFGGGGKYILKMT